MTVSTHDLTWTTLGLLGLFACACRPGLPPEPAGQDAADPGARAPKYETRPSPYETSAFEGVQIDATGGHGGMNHGGMNHGGMNHGGKPMDVSKGEHEGMDMPDKPAPKDPHKGMDMPADKPKSDERSEVQP